MKHADEKAFWLATVMKIMKWNDGTDAPSGARPDPGCWVACDFCIEHYPKIILMIPAMVAVITAVTICAKYLRHHASVFVLGFLSRCDRTA